jgi:hypothetical protein
MEFYFGGGLLKVERGRHACAKRLHAFATEALAQACPSWHPWWHNSRVAVWKMGKASTLIWPCTFIYSFVRSAHSTMVPIFGMRQAIQVLAKGNGASHAAVLLV